MFYDKNGAQVVIGDRVVPDIGHELIIVDTELTDDGDEALIGRSLDDLQMMSLLTAENLSTNWRKNNV